MFFWDDEGPQRRPFTLVAKRVEWLKAAGTENAKKVLLKYLADGKVPARMPRSKCRRCPKTLAWGDGTYNFDHKNNRAYDNSQRNCYLVCRNCHGRATKTKTIAQRNPFTGEVEGYRKIKLTADYKKPAKKPAKKIARKSVKKTAKRPARKTARTRR